MEHRKIPFLEESADIHWLWQEHICAQVEEWQPDLVIVSPVDAKACIPLFRRLNEAGIPVIAINLLPVQEAHRYLLSWTGPDDWGQMRLL